MWKLFLCCFYSCTCICGFSQNIEQSDILPTPVVYKKTKGNLYLTQKLSCAQASFPKNTYFQLKELLKIHHKLSLTGDTLGGKLIRLQKLKNVPKDFYSIAVNSTIFISYANERSLYYAFQSLMQLIKTEDNIKYIPKSFVQDYPKFEWRGLHLDVSRHFFSVDELKKFLDVMALYKFNKFHWHLTDDQGWRIEIKAFPKLTAIGGWRDSTLNNHYTTKPRSYDKKRQGGFYSQEQVKEVVRYASQRHISIVPEIEMPGHSRAALSAYPEYSCNEIQMPVPGDWGVFEDIYCTKEETFNFIEKILDEVAELFPGEYIHIGGDEAPKVRWEKCEKCQSVLQQNKLKNEEALQSYFINRIEKHLKTKNKKLIGWDEILQEGLSKNAAVMSWRGFKGGIKAAKQAHYVVMSPGSHCYFDHYQGKSKEEPLAIGGYTPLKKVYDFDPIPDGLTSSEADYVLGGQANLWTEYIPNMKALEYMAYPRAIALSQVLWCIEKPSYESFYTTLARRHFKILDNLGVNYSKTSQRPKIIFEGCKEGITIRLESKDTLETFETTVTSSNKKSILQFELTNNTALVLGNTRHKKIKSNIGFTSKNSALHSEIELIRHIGLGADIIFQTAPNPQYHSSDIVLLDGQRGARPWRGNEWIGFDTSNIVFEIKLGKKRKIKHIDLSFLESKGSWIYLPNKIEIEAFSRNSSTLYSLSNINNENLQFRIGKRTNKLKFQIVTPQFIPDGEPGAGHKPWTFIDEIVIH